MRKNKNARKRYRLKSEKCAIRMVLGLLYDGVCFLTYTDSDRT